MSDTDRGSQFTGNHARSPHWSHVRDEFLKIHSKCASCGATENLEAHHVVPFHICLELGRGYAELDPRNLIALCRAPRDCHLLLGHLDDFRSFNLGVRGSAPHYAHVPDAAGIKALEAWRTAHLHRPRNLDYSTTDEEKAAILAFIDKHFPIAAVAPAEGVKP